MIDQIRDQLGVTQAQLEELYQHPNFQEVIKQLEEKNPRFRTLSSDIKKLAMAMFLQGDMDKVSSMWKFFYRRPIPTIDEFLTPEYIGDEAQWYVPESPWTRDLKTILAPSSTVLEWAMSGSIGIAKTSVAVISQLYNLYRVTSLREPSLAMGEGKTKPMALMLLSVNRDKASELMNIMEAAIEECQYFVKVKSKKDFKEYTDLEYCQYVPYYVHNFEGFKRITFPNNVYIRPGSQKGHTIGSNLFGAIMDEAEFRGGAAKAEEAYDLYSEVLGRVTSRFINSQYKLVNLISSVKFDTGIMARHIENLIKEKELGKSYVSAYAQWEVKPEYWNAIKEFGYIYVLAGNISHPSKILDDEEFEAFENDEYVIPEQCRVVKVPKHPDLLTPFLRNPDRALRDQAGIVTAGGERPFSDLSKLVDKNLIPELTLHADFTEEKSLFEQLPQEDLFQKTPDGLKLRRFPNAKRYIHLDLADTGEAGISLCHKEVKSDGHIMYVFDFVSKVVSKTRLSQTKIEEFLVDLKEVGNVYIEKLSADQYQSTYMRERLEKLHKVAKEVKKVPMGGETNIEPFITCSYLIAEGNVKVGECEQLKNQLKGIYIHNDRLQYDKALRKDIADTFIGTLYISLNNALDVPTNVYDTYEKIKSTLDLGTLPGVKTII